MAKVITCRELSRSLTLSQCTDGYWLYDKTRGMNLALRSDSPEAAMLAAIEYYQRRLSTVEGDYKQLAEKVDVFIESLRDDEGGNHEH